MEGGHLLHREGRKPEEFPVAVWHDINRYVLSLQLNEKFPGFRKMTVYACSTDGMMPALFHLERLPAIP